MLICILDQLQRILTYCHRFILGCRRQLISAGLLKHIELDHIFNIAFKLTQEQDFLQLINQLTKSQIISPASVAQLAAFIDSNGLIFVSGHLRFFNLH